MAGNHSKVNSVLGHKASGLIDSSQNSHFNSVKKQNPVKLRQLNTASSKKTLQNQSEEDHTHYINSHMAHNSIVNQTQLENSRLEHTQLEHTRLGDTHLDQTL